MFLFARVLAARVGFAIGGALGVATEMGARDVCAGVAKAGGVALRVLAIACDAPDSSVSSGGTSGEGSGGACHSCGAALGGEASLRVAQVQSIVRQKKARREKRLAPRDGENKVIATKT